VLVVENEQKVFTAIMALKHRKGSFADAIIPALGTRAGRLYNSNIRPEGDSAFGFRLA
jgi:hypothetical protein